MRDCRRQGGPDGLQYLECAATLGQSTNLNWAGQSPQAELAEELAFFIRLVCYARKSAMPRVATVKAEASHAEATGCESRGELGNGCDLEHLCAQC
jgi:hypothetical protein